MMAIEGKKSDRGTIDAATTTILVRLAFLPRTDEKFEDFTGENSKVCEMSFWVTIYARLFSRPPDSPARQAFSSP